MTQIAAEEKLANLDNYEKSPLYTERERVALRYTDAICWNPASADDEMWKLLHAHFTEPELVELGCFVALTFGQQSWIRLLGIGHQEYDVEGIDSTAGLAPGVARG